MGSGNDQRSFEKSVKNLPPLFLFIDSECLALRRLKAKLTSHLLERVCADLGS